MKVKVKKIREKIWKLLGQCLNEEIKNKIKNSAKEYFLNHYSPLSHRDGHFHLYAWDTIGTCRCPRCIANGILRDDDAYDNVELTQEKLEKTIKHIAYCLNIRGLIMALKEEGFKCDYEALLLYILEE